MDVANWAGPCAALSRTYRKLFVDLGNEGVKFVTASAQTIDELASFYDQSEPTVLLFKDGKQFSTLRGARAAEVEEAVEKYQPKEGDDDCLPDFSAPHLSLRQQNAEEEEAAAAKIQAVYRRNHGGATRAGGAGKGKAESEEALSEINLNDPEVEDAALKIQAVFRGHRVRTGSALGEEENGGEGGEVDDVGASDGNEGGDAEGGDAGGGDAVDGDAVDGDAVGGDAGGDAGASGAAGVAGASGASGASGMTEEEARSLLLESKPNLGFVANDKTKQVLVTDVRSETAAEAAGIYTGDIIMGIGKVPVKTMKGLSKVFRSAFPGSTQTFRIVRKSEPGRTHAVSAGKKIALPVMFGIKGMRMSEVQALVDAAGADWVAEQAARKMAAQ